jgi:carboxypeptidase Taq
LSKDIKGFKNQIKSGDFKELLQWLRQNIHQYGRRFKSEELCTRITGRGLDFASFMNYATDKYTSIYKLT